MVISTYNGHVVWKWRKYKQKKAGKGPYVKKQIRDHTTTKTLAMP